jgi:hypothetical protein
MITLAIAPARHHFVIHHSDIRSGLSAFRYGAYNNLDAENALGRTRPARHLDRRN